MSEQKPREFWLQVNAGDPYQNIYRVDNPKWIDPFYKLHVVEMSAYIALQAEIERLKVWSSDCHIQDVEAENERLKKLISKELNENDELGAEYTYVNILKAELERYKRAVDHVQKNLWRMAAPYAEQTDEEIDAILKGEDTP